MSSKAEKKRRRKARGITLPGGEVAKQRPTGRDRRHTNQREEDPRAVVVAARVRRMGKTGKEGREAALAVEAGDELGLCILAMIPTRPVQGELWQIWQSISAAKLAWGQRIIGAVPHPQAAAMPMLSDRMETDQSHSVDLRTPEERDDAARAGWERWLGLMHDHLGQDCRTALRGHLDGFGAPLWNEHEHRPTLQGTLAVRALEKLRQAQNGA